MSTIRRRRPKYEFTQIPNAALRDYRLSWRARGLLAELLSYPPGYEITVDELVKRARRQGGRVEGRDAMRAAVRELKAVGYITSTKRQDERGRWITEVEVGDDPAYELPNPTLPEDAPPPPERVSPGRTDDGFPGVGAPGVGGPGVTRNTDKNTEKNTSSHYPSSSAPPSAVEAGTKEEEEEEKKKGKKEEEQQQEEAAERLVASALRFWDSSHARPSAPTRRKLVSRVAQELAAGADPDAVFAELVRDLHPSQARSAVRVVMARTRIPGWAQGGETPARLMANVRPPWCGTCDEATRHLVEVLADGRDQVVRCPYCHPVAVAEHTTITETTETPTATPAHQEPQTAAERTQSAEEPERGPRGEREPFDPATKPEAPGVCGVHRTTLTADAQCLVCLSEVEAEQAAYGPQANVDSPEPPTGPVDPAAGSDGDSEDPDEIRALIEQSLNSASPRGADHGGRKGRGWTPPPVIAELRERLAKIQERSA